MKRINILLLALAALFMLSCNNKEEDNRVYESADLAAVLINDKLYTPENTDNNAVVILTPGVDLSNIRLSVIAINGELSGIKQNAEIDARLPISLHLSGFNGEEKDWTLRIQSPPLLTNVLIESLYIPKTDIHFSTNSIIVQVPVGTNVRSLKVTPEFINGEVINFNTGPVDYTNPVQVKVKGVDGTTIYEYKLIFTDEEVGPANIKSITINGVKSDSLIIIDSKTNTLQPYLSYLTNLTKADVNLEVGYGNEIDKNFTGKEMNLLSSFKVKVTGSNGVVTEFTIKTPLIASKPILQLKHSDFKLAANAGSSVGFTNGNIVIAAHQMATGVLSPVFGLHAYDLKGNFLNELNKDGTNIDAGVVNGVRKLATDSDGAILGIQLGATAAASVELKIFKWDNINSKPSTYISYSANSLGVASARSAGINVTGSLKGNAKIMVGISVNPTVLVWTVTNGVLDPTPSKMTLPSNKISVPNYYSVEPLNNNSYTVAITGSGQGEAMTLSGLLGLNSGFSEVFRLSAPSTTDLKVLEHNGRRYCAYTIFVGGDRGHLFRISDVTEGVLESYQTLIMDLKSGLNVANGNNTLDSDLAVINGKLYVLFYGTNDGLYVYQLEK